MQIKFVRSGGIAGAATNVEGVVKFGDDGVQVNSDVAKYDRKLPAEEAEQLRSAADAASRATAKGAAGAEPSAIRDGYQYEITILTNDGKTHGLTLDGEGGISPEIANLGNWVRQETQKIWSHKISNR
jgi:hypothetical protein